MLSNDYISDIPDIPNWLVTSAEFLTILVSLAGIIVALHHASFFSRDNKVLSLRIKNVFLSDAAVYLVTLVMGVALYYNWPYLVKIDVIIRPFVLAVNVWVSVRLYKHYRKYK